MKNALLILLALIPQLAFARHHSISGTRSAQADTAAPRRHKVLWFTPNRRSTEIDGLALGFWAAPDKRQLIIKGVNVEASPAALLLWFYSMIGLISGPFSHDTTTDMAVITGAKFPESDTSFRAKISGLSISTAQLSNEMKGVGLNLVSSWANEMHGLEISGFTNMHYRSGGLILALRNKVTHCNGVQIGIFNECRDGTLLQIGLLNRIGKRRVPFVNCSLRRKNKAG